MEISASSEPAVALIVTTLIALIGAVWRVSSQATSIKIDAVHLREELQEMRALVADLRIVPLLKLEVEGLKQSIARFSSDIRELREQAALDKGFRKALKSRPATEDGE